MEDTDNKIKQLEERVRKLELRLNQIRLDIPYDDEVYLSLGERLRKRLPDKKKKTSKRRKSRW